MLTMFYQLVEVSRNNVRLVKLVRMRLSVFDYTTYIVCNEQYVILATIEQDDSNSEPDWSRRNRSKGN